MILFALMEKKIIIHCRILIFIHTYALQVSNSCGLDELNEMSSKCGLLQANVSDDLDLNNFTIDRHRELSSEKEDAMVCRDGSYTRTRKTRPEPAPNPPHL